MIDQKNRSMLERTGAELRGFNPTVLASHSKLQEAYEEFAYECNAQCEQLEKLFVSFDNEVCEYLGLKRKNYPELTRKSNSIQLYSAAGTVCYNMRDHIVWMAARKLNAYNERQERKKQANPMMTQLVNLNDQQLEEEKANREG